MNYAQNKACKKNNGFIKNLKGTLKKIVRCIKRLSGFSKRTNGFIKKHGVLFSFANKGFCKKIEAPNN